MSLILSAWLRHAPTSLLAVALAAFLAVGALTEAPTPTVHAPQLRESAYPVSTARTVLRVARSKAGAPYRYGATGPRAFDCSGYTRWVFARAGKHLPRTSGRQYTATRHLRRVHRRIGDLVFFHSGRHVYHVGIYAGRGRVWHAPYPGRRVNRERIWTRAVWYGRVR